MIYRSINLHNDTLKSNNLHMVYKLINLLCSLEMECLFFFKLEGILYFPILPPLHCDCFIDWLAIEPSQHPSRRSITSLDMLSFAQSWPFEIAFIYKGEISQDEIAPSNKLVNFHNLRIMVFSLGDQYQVSDADYISNCDILHYLEAF